MRRIRRKVYSQRSLIVVAIAGFLGGAAIAFGLTFFWQVRFDDRIGLERGRDLANLACARCHGVGQSDKSSRPDAPPFRVLVAKLSPEGLAEQLEIGLSLGHKPMPAWNISPEQSADLLTFMISLQK